MRFLEAPTGTATIAAAVMKAALYPSTITTSLVSDYESAAQRPLAKSAIFRVDASTWPDGGFTMRNYCSTAKMQGVPPERVLYDGFFHGLVNATPPTNIWYWNCVFAPTAGTESQVTDIAITVIYYTELYDLVDLAST